MRLWAFSFLSGILIVQQLSSLPVLSWLAVGLLSIIAIKPFRKRISNSWLLVLASGLAFGFAWALGHAHWMMSQRLLPQYEGVDLVIEGQIISLPVSPLKTPSAKQYGFGQQRVRFDFKPTKISLAGKLPKNIARAQFPKRIRLSWYKPTAIVEAGQFWRFTVRLKRPYGLMNPGGFDYESWLFQKRIQAKGSIRNNINNQLLIKYTSSSFAYTLMLEFRQLILNKITNKLEIGEHSAFIRNVTQSLILGYRGGLDASQWQTFQRTGTTHLMAISGLHIGLVAALIYGLAGLLWRHSGRLIRRGCQTLAAPQFAAIAALLAAVLYAILAGFTIPTQRALVMLSVAMLHIVFKRTPLPASKTIAVALVLVLLLDPLAVLAQGFWLSFMAVSLIIYLMRLSNPWQTFSSEKSEVIDELVFDTKVDEKSFIRKLVEKFVLSILNFGRIQWLLTVAMFPMVLYFYQSSSLVSPIANFVAIPVISLAVVPLMFVATLFLFINTSIANLLFSVVDFVYSWLWQFLESLAGWQYATVEFSIGSLWGMLFCYLAIVLWLCVKGTPMRWLALVFILPVLFYSTSSLKQGEAIVTVLDVGQGLSTIVQTKLHTLVFDTGPRYSQNFDTGRAVIIPYLRKIGRSNIDTLILSHGDNDHVGGFNSIASMMPINHVLSSIPDSSIFDSLIDNSWLYNSFRNKSQPLKERQVSMCHLGQKWQYDGVEFAIVSPLEFIQSENGHDENNQSCVLKVTTQFGRVLVSGDIERETESYLYHVLPEKLAAEILVIPHHGSNTSSLEGFIKAVAPQYAVFTVGYKNRYRLPNSKVISRYQQLSQAKLFRSNETGALIFKLQHDSALQPLEYRKLARRYWHTSDLEAF